MTKLARTVYFWGWLLIVHVALCMYFASRDSGSKDELRSFLVLLFDSTTNVSLAVFIAGI